MQTLVFAPMLKNFNHIKLGRLLLVDIQSRPAFQASVFQFHAVSDQEKLQ